MTLQTLLHQVWNLFASRPGDSGQRARVLRHYAEIGANYGSARRKGSIIDAFWSRWARPREVRIVMAVIDARPGETVLDVGCGSGTYAKLLAANGNPVMAVDSCASMVEAVRPSVCSAQVAEIETLALFRQFDLVLCLGVLDFVADPASCLLRLAQHVKQQGRLIALVPRRGPRGWYYAIAKLLSGIRVNTFDLESLDALARQCGLVREASASPLPNSLVVRWRREI